MLASYSKIFVWGLSLACLSTAAPLENTVPASEVSTQEKVQMNPACDLFYEVQSGDTCWDIINRNENNFTIKQLLCWNPDINPRCTNLIPGRDICVGVAYPAVC